MAGFNYRLDENRSLVSPVVGDAEIRGVQFENPNMLLHIVQPFDGTQIDLIFSGMLFLYFHTDFPQNVIESIFIYESWESARFPAEVDQDALRKEFRSGGRYIIVIESIAGGPLVCGARDLSIKVGAC